MFNIFETRGKVDKLVGWIVDNRGTEDEDDEVITGEEKEEWMCDDVTVS